MTDSATWSERWAERSSPAFGQLVTWFLLIAGGGEIVYHLKEQ